MHSFDSLLSEFPVSSEALPPSLADIGRFTDNFRDILFPDGPQGALVRERFVRLTDDLRQLIGRSLHAAQEKTSADDLAGVALRAFPQIRHVAREDIDAALRGDPAARSAGEIIRYYPGFRATLSYRVAHLLYDLGVPFLPRGITEYAHAETGIDIHPGADIGRRFFIDHGTGVVIGETADIGNDVKIYQGVTLGARSFRHDEHGKVIREEKRHPTLEDRVVVYANATILGGSTVIGRDAVIGANVWLLESVPPGSKVFITPPPVLTRTRTSSDPPAP